MGSGVDWAFRLGTGAGAPLAAEVGLVGGTAVATTTPACPCASSQLPSSAPISPTAPSTPSLPHAAVREGLEIVVSVGMAVPNKIVALSTPRHKR